MLSNPVKTQQRPHRGGRGRCASCEHPDQKLINEGLAAGKSLLSLSKRFHITRSSLKHHRAHLSESLVAIQTAAGAEGIVEQLQDLVRRARRFLDSAELSGNSAQGLTAIRELRESLLVLGRVTGELTPAPVVVDLATMPAFIAMRTKMVRALAAFPEARLAIVAVLDVDDA